MSSQTVPRYQESKERSVEILRAALAHMGQHDAALNPLSFAVWYEHAAGASPNLSRAIAERLRTEPRFGDATIAQLYRDHVGPPDEQRILQANGEIQRVISGMAESAARTGERAGEFNRTLDGLQGALRSPSEAGLAPAINEALEASTDMKQSISTLQKQVAAGRRELEQLRGELTRVRDESLVDPLTRVLNRKAFDEQLEAMIALARDRGGSHCLAMLDIDLFKGVNDSFGHVMGDRVLQAVGELLRGGVADPAHAVARYGGEEFAILMPRCTLDAAVASAQQHRERVKAMRIRDRRSQHVVLTITVSAGVAGCVPGDDSAALIARADEALYRAKRLGRDRVESAAT